jgi:hypothetical protein
MLGIERALCIIALEQRGPMARRADRQQSRGAAPFPHQRQLIAWADRIYSDEQPAVRPRIGVVRRGGVDAIDVAPIVGRHGMDAIFQSAAVVARTAADDEPVFIFLYANLSGSVPAGATVKRGGFADGYAACLLARTKNGEKFARFWQTEQIKRGTTRTISDDASESTFEGYPDWLEPDYWIDAALEDVLERAQVPGAVRRSRPKTSAAKALLAPTTDAPNPNAPPPPPPPPPSHTEPRDIEFPWEAARAAVKDLGNLTTGELGWTTFATTPAALPIDLERRTLEDLMRDGWSSEAQACHLIMKLSPASMMVSLEMFLSGNLPLIATMFGCAVAAEVGLKQRDLHMLQYATAQLERRVETAIAGAGGLTAWLDTQWPTKPTFASMLGTVGISCAANDAFWRVFMAMMAPLDLPLAPDASLTKALARAVALRDWILDRAGVAAGPPGERVAALARMVLHAVPSADGEPRLDHWRDVVRERHGKEVPELVLRDYTSVHAAVLHTIVVVTELRLARFMAIGELKDDDGWHPERASTCGLLKHGLDVIARHVVDWAARATDVDNQLALLQRARAVAPWDDAIVRSFNEARARAERWDDALLDDLWKEANATDALAPVGEALEAAVELGRKDIARSARRRLVALAASGPHAWIAAARALFARPSELAQADRIREVEALPKPGVLDPSDRTVRALYGPTPTERVAELEAALRAQRDLVEMAELERDDRRATEAGIAPRGPDVPARPGDDAVGRARRALGARMLRPRLARGALGHAVEDHARRALELTASESEPTIGAWLEAVRAFVAKADAEIASEATVDEAALAKLLANAERALGDALIEGWALGVLQRLAPIRPMLPRAGARARELARRTSAIEQAAMEAATDEARRAVDEDLARLLDEAMNISTAFVDDDEDEAQPTSEAAPPNRFRAMNVLPGAIERSLRELDTADWAIREGLDQITQFNLANGKRDVKMLQGTRESGAPIWELRHYNRRSGIRVLFVLRSEGPRACAIMAKIDDAQQNRVIERVKGWLRAGF